MQWLKVSFSQDWFCSAATFTDAQAQAQAQVWAANFGPGFGTGLLTLSSGATLLKRHGTLYVQAPDNVTADTFAFLAPNWSHDCITVDKIETSDGPPDPSDEQAAVDAAHPGVAQTIADLLAALGKDILLAGVVLLVVVLVVERERK